ncbi:hypothetical protein MC885_000805 [Smutsia gigantea]|nr:hypothetical protein MC885_000805 [Smutsia gigantea]
MNDWRGSSREGPDSLGTLLGEFLPSRFQQLLRQLGAEIFIIATSKVCVRALPASSVFLLLFPPRPVVSVSDLLLGMGVTIGTLKWGTLVTYARGQSLNFQNSLKKILLHQIPALGPLHSQFTTVKKANQ